MKKPVEKPSQTLEKPAADSGYKSTDDREYEEWLEFMNDGGIRGGPRGRGEMVYRGDDYYGF